MNLSINWINNSLVEVKTDEIATGVLNAKEARELAKNLIVIASDLLEVEDTK